MADQIDFYNPTYGDFGAAVMEQIRRETYGDDIGQNSWLTADEFRRFHEMLELTSESEILEVACGSGGPALFTAQTIGCRVTGVDINENAIAHANRLAVRRGLDTSVRFQRVDASRPLPFPPDSFTTIVCIDSINHLPDRWKVLAEWYRLLRPGGRVLFTDPIVVTGMLSNDEMSIRSSIGYFVFVPPGENERLLNDAGFELRASVDVTSNAAVISKRWYDARRERRNDLLIIENENTFEGIQRFLNVVHRLSEEKRLSRIAFLACKPL